MTQNRQNYKRLGETAVSGELEHLLGQKAIFNDLDYSSTSQIKPDLSQIEIEAVWVKNRSGGALLPRAIVKWHTSYPGTGIVDETTTNDVAAGVVDPYLPAAGVANNDHFWLIRKGPAKIDSDGAAITTGDLVQTAVTGYGKTWAAGTENEKGIVGRAMAAAVAASSPEDLRILVDCRL